MEDPTLDLLARVLETVKVEEVGRVWPEEEALDGHMHRGLRTLRAAGNEKLTVLEEATLNTAGEEEEILINVEEEEAILRGVSMEEGSARCVWRAAVISTVGDLWGPTAVVKHLGKADCEIEGGVAKGARGEGMRSVCDQVEEWWIWMGPGEQPVQEQEESESEVLKSLRRSLEAEICPSTLTLRWPLRLEIFLLGAKELFEGVQQVWALLRAHWESQEAAGCLLENWVILGEEDWEARILRRWPGWEMDRTCC